MESLSGSQMKAQFQALEIHLQMPKITKFNLGLCQLSVSSDKNTNLARARSSIEVAANRGATLVLLPIRLLETFSMETGKILRASELPKLRNAGAFKYSEMWNCPYSSDYFGIFSENFDYQDHSPSFSMLSEAALAHRITIIGGTIPEKRSQRLYNTCCVFGPDGKLKAKQSKMHMFDVDIPGDIVFKESDTFTAGDQPTIVKTDMGCIGIGICHDIRFPELAMLYRAQGAHLICYPGAFNMSTGEALWEIEQRARAADNQLYVATCSPSRDSVADYMIWGHSTVVGPSGQIIATSGGEETVVIAEIDYSAIQDERLVCPLPKQKRQEVYQFIEICSKNQ